MRGIATLAVVLGVMLAPATAAGAPDRYSIASGCYTLAGVAGAEKLRLQATTLGEYLLFRPDGTFLTAQADGSVAPTAAPSPAAEWKAEEGEGGRFVFTPKLEGGRALAGELVPADGCAIYPEAPLNATGKPRESFPFGRVGGLVEGHMHWMTFEYFGRNFHCGTPWHPYGIQYALPDCSSIEGPQGVNAPWQNTLNYGNPAQPHDTSGYPTLTGWSRDNLTYEGTYYRWVERAWLAGMRLTVMGVNENRELCELQTNRETNCNEMDTLRRAIADMRELERYVDAQAGGPGKGFFQIVTDPFQARRVINAGKLAVVLEIELSEPFDCRGWETPTCDQKLVDAQLDEAYRLGVRSSLLVGKFDNPLVGVRFDSGATGVIINQGNRNSAGTYWDAETCKGPLADNTIESFSPELSAGLNALFDGAGVPGGTAPAYPPAPHCNTRGLTDLGKHVVRRMMDLKMIVNPDHMSQAGVDETLKLLEARSYSAVISPHGWMDPGNWPRLWKLGGMAFPGHTVSTEYVKEWQKYRPKETPFEFGWGYGADLGGLSHQPDPPGGQGAIQYPFKSYDGSVTFDRQKTGERTFDYVKEGVAHYGLYAEWFEDLHRLGGDAMARDMWEGSEAYLQMWERAHGIATPGCASARGKLSRSGLGPLRLGADWQALLRAAGQPQQRTRAWSYCVPGKGNGARADVAVLNDRGTVALVGSTARGRSAGGVRVGAPVAKMRVKPRSAGRGLLTRRAGRHAWVFSVRKGRISAVAVASARLRGRALRAAMSELVAAKATQTRREYRPSQAETAAGGKLSGRTLAGTDNPKLDAALALLCGLTPQRL